MKQYRFLFSIALLIFSYGIVGNCFADQQINVNLKLGLIHGFSGTLSFVDQYYSDGTYLYTSGSTVALQVNTSTLAEYTIVGDNIMVGSGALGSGYNSVFTTPLLGGDRYYQFYASFVDQSNQWLDTNRIGIIKDSTAPSQVDTLSIQFTESAGNSGVFITWDSSFDLDSGLRGYHIVVGSDQTFLNSVSFDSFTESLVIEDSLLPAGYEFVKIIAIDNVGNSSESMPVQFSLDQSSGNSQSGSQSSDSTVDDQSNQSIRFSQPPTSPNNQKIIQFIPIQSVSKTPLKNSEALVLPSPEIIFYTTTSQDDEVQDTLSPSPGVRLNQSPQDQDTSIIICSDEQCVEVHDTGIICDETICLDYGNQIQRLHYVASSANTGTYDALIQHHIQRTRKLQLMLVFLFFNCCYDIEIHLRRRNAFYLKNM